MDFNEIRSTSETLSKLAFRANDKCFIYETKNIYHRHFDVIVFNQIPDPLKDMLIQAHFIKPVYYLRDGQSSNSETFMINTSFMKKEYHWHFDVIYHIPYL